MQKRQMINERQLSWLTGAILTGGGLVSVQNLLVRISKADTWLSYLLPTLYTFLVAGVFVYLSKTFPRKNLFDIMFTLFGRWGGGILNAVFIFHLWLILIRDVSLFNRFVHTILLPRTPLEILSLLFAFLLVYYGRSSLEIVARVNDVFFPLFVLIIVTMPFALSNEIRLGLLQPYMSTSYVRLISSNLIAGSWFADVFVLGAFLHMLHNSRQVSAGLRRGATLAAFLLTIMLLLEIAVFGPYLPGNFIYPGYSLVQQIHITDFLDRVDLIMLMIWFPTAACKLLTIYLALLTGLASFMKKPEPSALNKPVALALLITSVVSFQSTTEVFSFGNFSSPIIVLAYQPLFLVLLAVGAKLYRKRHPELAALSAPSEPNGSIRPNTKDSIWKRFSAKFPHSTWFRASNVILSGLIVITSVGLFVGRRWGWAGKTCTLLFIAGMALFLFTTFAEMKTAEER